MVKDSLNASIVAGSSKPYRPRYRKCFCTGCIRNPSACLQNERAIRRHIQRDEDEAHRQTFLESRVLRLPEAAGPILTPISARTADLFSLHAPSHEDVQELPFWQDESDNTASVRLTGRISGPHGAQTHPAESLHSDPTLSDAAGSQDHQNTLDTGKDLWELSSESRNLSLRHPPSQISQSSYSARSFDGAADFDVSLVSVEQNNPDDPGADSYNDSEDDEGINLTGDPLYASREALFDDVFESTHDSVVMH